MSFTFEEAADLAEHWKNDLGIDRALLVLAGWNNQGYDSALPDILPAAPEVGGNEALAACSKRVRDLGWLFGLHDNYRDTYRNARTFDEGYVMKNADGSLHKGFEWLGGVAHVVCPRMSLELAARPQNMPGVRERFAPNLYFIDCTIAAPPYRCFDPNHPVRPHEDIALRRRLLQYTRRLFGAVGSEEGREWGVPDADYFEGLMGHRTGYLRYRDPDWNSLPVIPLFHLVYADAIPIYSHQSDRPRPDNPEYILHHILHAEMPVYYFGRHRYWTDPEQEFRPAEDAAARLVFAQGGRFGLIDQFIKNTYEVLSPLHRLTALLPMTGHRFLTKDRQVETARFGDDVNITVNFGPEDFAAGHALLPRYGFLVESPTLVAFYARQYRTVSYAEPALLVLQSLDGQPLASSRRVRVYHGFGGRRVEWRGKIFEVDAERILTGEEPAAPPAARTPSPLSLSERVAADVQDIYFDSGSSRLGDEARVLAVNARALRAVFRDFPNAIVVVEGHCDPGEPAELSLELAERRAMVVKEALVLLGVQDDRLDNIAVGSDQPACTAPGEACRQRNRRVHISAHHQ